MAMAMHQGADVPWSRRRRDELVQIATAARRPMSTRRRRPAHPRRPVHPRRRHARRARRAPPARPRPARRGQRAQRGAARPGHRRPRPRDRADLRGRKGTVTFGCRCDRARGSTSASGATCPSLPPPPMPHGRGWRIRPPARSSRSRPGVRRLLAGNPSPFTYTGTQTYIVGAGEVAVIDPGPDLARACRRHPRRHAGRADRRDPVHPHPPRPQPGEPAARCGDAARRSSAALRSRSTMTARAPTPPSISTMRRIACSADGEALDGRRLAADGGGDAGPHLQPSLLRAGRHRRPLHRRSCHGLVDHRGVAARRRHDALHAEPRPAARPRRPGLSSRARPGGRQAAQPCPRPDRPPPDAREADPEAARRRGGADPDDGRDHVPGHRSAAVSRPPGARCSPICVDLEARGLVRSEGETWTLAA